MKNSLLTKNPTLNLTIGAIVISFSGVWVKIAEVSPSSSAFYRVFFGFFFLLVFAFQTKIKFAANRLHISLGIFCGLLFALDLLCWHNSIRLIGPGLATLLGNFQVFILAAVGILFLKERYSKILLLAIPLAVVGLFLIIGFEWSTMGADYTLGLGLGLATALLYSGFLLSLKSLSSRIKDPYSPMIIVSFATSVIIGVSMLSTGDSFTIPNMKSLLSLVGLGFLSQCFGWVCIASSLPRVNTSFVGLILLLQPSLAFIWDVLFFARPTALLNWSGVCITLFSIYLGSRAKC